MTTTEERWSAIDDHFLRALAPPDPVLDAVLAANAAAGLPPYDVSPSQGKLLEVLARMHRARTILEIGTLGGYSTIWLARALPPGGRVITLELDPKHAEVARANLERAGLRDAVEVRVGRAVDTLRALATEARDPFDLTFIDADKPSNAEYFAHALSLSRPGSVIIVDNVVRGGAVLDAHSSDASVVGVHRLLDAIAAEPRVSATVIQTVGSKGHDGFLIALVL